MDKLLQRKKEVTAKLIEHRNQIKGLIGAETRDSAKLDAIKQTVEELKAELATINSDIELLESVEDVEDIVDEVVDEIEGVKTDEEVEEENLLNNNQEGEKRSMKKVIGNSGFNAEKDKDFTEFLRSRGAKISRSITSATDVGEAVVPKEYKVVDEIEEELDLMQYIDVIPTKNGSGSYSYISDDDSVLYSVAELEQNPELANPVVRKVNFDIETYRGQTGVSNEVISDSDFDIKKTVSKKINNTAIRTKTRAVIKEAMKFPKRTASSLDELKAIVNKELKRTGKNIILVNQNLYHELDTMKDLEGRYLLQNDITVKSGKSLGGIEIVVVDNSHFVVSVGDTEGNLTKSLGIFGKLKDIKGFDREEETVYWATNDKYGKFLMHALRMDIVLANTESGFFVEFTPEA